MSKNEEAKIIKKTGSRGLGVVGCLILLFIILKIAGVIDWSWWWVLSPAWITCIVAVISFSIILVVGKIKKGRW
ncbi:hypothetical protein IKF34_02670 [Candidatus Saccharibacteria bacterium]|nr:hypothetical protein [Candidatus Saccharibacteria bacterium]